MAATLLLVAAAALTFLIKDSKMFDVDMLPVRAIMQRMGKFATDLTSCSFCLGFWAGLSVWALARHQELFGGTVVGVGAAVGFVIACILVAATWRSLVAGALIGVFLCTAVLAVPLIAYTVGAGAAVDAVLFGLAASAVSYLFDGVTLRLDQGSHGA